MYFEKIPRPVRYLIYDEIDHESLPALQRTNKFMCECIRKYLKKGRELMETEMESIHYRHKRYLFANPERPASLVMFSALARIEKFYERIKDLAECEQICILYNAVFAGNKGFYEKYHCLVPYGHTRICVLAYPSSSVCDYLFDIKLPRISDFMIYACAYDKTEIVSYQLAKNAGYLNFALKVTCIEKNVIHFNYIIDFIERHTRFRQAAGLWYVYLSFLLDEDGSKRKFIERYAGGVDWRAVLAAAIGNGNTKAIKHLIDIGHATSNFPK